MNWSRCAMCFDMRPVAGRGGRRAAGIAHRALAGVEPVEHRAEPRLDEGPGAHVLRLFLAPDDLGVGEARQEVAHRLQRERIELLDAQQVDVVDAARLALLVEVEIDLAGADDDAADLLVRRRA